jgi:sugar lactone lactonase YvrE
VLRQVLGDLHLPECPRWYDGALWLSDMWGHEVLRVDEDGVRRVVHRFPDDENPGGLGWLPDGRQLVVGMEGRVIYVLDGDHRAVYADLRDLATSRLNDMIVATDGTAYVSQFGWDVWDGDTHADTTIIRVHPDGRADTAAGAMDGPNGIALTDDGTTMVVAEPGGGRISRFTVTSDGDLVDRRVVPLERAPGAAHVTPDGLCLDAEGGVWIADPLGHRVLHLSADDAVDRVLPVDDGRPFACVLGGPGRRTLYICVGGNQITRPTGPSTPLGRLLALEVAVPGAGRP